MNTSMSYLPLTQRLPSFSTDKITRTACVRVGALTLLGWSRGEARGNGGYGKGDGGRGGS